MAKKVAINAVNYNFRNAQNGKSIKLSKEKHKLKIKKLTEHQFYNIYIFTLRTTEFSFGKKAFFNK